jgi:hypothetical protein
MASSLRYILIEHGSFDFRQGKSVIMVHGLMEHRLWPCAYAVELYS